MFYNQLFALFTLTLGLNLASCAVLPQLNVTGHLTAKSQIDSSSNFTHRIFKSPENQESAIKSQGKAIETFNFIRNLERNLSSPKTKVFTVISWIKLNWYMALYDCKARGLRLATIESEAEQQQVVNLIKAQAIEADGDTSFWVSGSDLGRMNDYMWMTTGKSIQGYTAWYIGSNRMEPNHEVIDGEMEHCMCLRNDEGYAWNDDRCSASSYYICDNQNLCGIL